MSDHLSGTYLPPSVGEVEKILYTAFDRLAGVDLFSETAPWVFREEFAHGGLSGGSIHLETWRVVLLPLLIDRARGQLDG